MRSCEEIRIQPHARMFSQAGRVTGCQQITVLVTLPHYICRRKALAQSCTIFVRCPLGATYSVLLQYSVVRGCMALSTHRLLSATGVCDTANDFQTLSRDVVRLYGEGNMKITTKYGSYTSLPDCGFWMSAPFIVLESHNKAQAKVCFPSSKIAAYNNCMLTM